MSLFGKVKVYFTPRRTLREEVERAYGLWLAGPQTTNSATFVSNMTGIPREDVWDILLGRKKND